MFLLFIVLLIVTFGMLMLFLRPTSTEVAVEQHLAGIKGQAVDSGTPASILRKDGLSSNPTVDALLKQVPLSTAIAHLIRQAGVDWAVGPVLGISTLAFFFGWWIGSIVMPTDVLGFLMGVVLALTPFIILFVKRAARFKKFDALLPEAVDLMSRG